MIRSSYWLIASHIGMPPALARATVSFAVPSVACQISCVGAPSGFGYFSTYSRAGAHTPLRLPDCVLRRETNLLLSFTGAGPASRIGPKHGERDHGAKGCPREGRHRAQCPALPARHKKKKFKRCRGVRKKPMLEGRRSSEVASRTGSMGHGVGRNEEERGKKRTMSDGGQIRENVLPKLL